MAKRINDDFHGAIEELKEGKNNLLRAGGHKISLPSTCLGLGMEPLHLDLWVRNYPTLNRNQQSGTGFKEKGLKNSPA